MKNQSQIPLRDDTDTLKAWSTVGAPGRAPATPFSPDIAQMKKLKPVISPKIFAVDWTLDQQSYQKLQYGHEAMRMEDKWNVYTNDNIVHFHRSWTGAQIFQFKLDKAGDGSYKVAQFTVEQDPEQYKSTDEQEIKDTLLMVLRDVMDVNFASTQKAHVKIAPKIQPRTTLLVIVGLGVVVALLNISGESNGYLALLIPVGILSLLIKMSVSSH